jgi:Cof subfamily protein (haloacid dehalogenase superfamily)
MSFRLVATDLDGTLLREDHTVSDRTRAALAAAEAAGARHVIVTGRSVSWCRPVLDLLGCTGLVVCSQGSQLYHAGERRLLTSVTLDRQVARTAIAKLTADLGPLKVAVSRAGVDGGVLVERGYRYEQRLPVTVVDNRDELWSEPILKLYVQHATHRDDELVERCGPIVAGLCDVTHAGGDIVELLPAGLSKAVGLSIVARRLKVRAPEVVAFGDMPNDLTMLRWAGHGVAMANAHPSVRETADEITASNEDDGVALVLERVFG